MASHGAGNAQIACLGNLGRQLTVNSCVLQIGLPKTAYPPNFELLGPETAKPGRGGPDARGFKGNRAVH